MIQSVSGNGKLCLFYTTFARKFLKRPWPDWAKVTQYSNHLGRNLLPSEDELKNLALMPAEARLYIVCEDKCVKWNTARKKTE